MVSIDHANGQSQVVFDLALVRDNQAHLRNDICLQKFDESLRIPKFTENCHAQGSRIQ